MADQEMYIGRTFDGGSEVTLDMDHLTTHAVCFGMTGSGKTGLGIVALEELARVGVPLLVIDLKGDMVNLLLNFPDLLPEDFEPWIPRDQVGPEGRHAAAAVQARIWSEGLSGSGLGSPDLTAVQTGVRWQLLTPGAASVAPLDILPTLSPPEGWDPASDPDAVIDRVAGVAGALLSLIGRGGDPLTDADTVLLSSVLLEHWRRGEGLDLPGLLASVADPPMDTMGALPLETFYPRKDRMKLVLELNALVASPAFAAWTKGTALDMAALLGTDSAPKASIISVAHLDDRQRLFVLGLLVSELVSWMRRQPGASGLRALLYMDEVHGILPPHPFNPPTKGPLLTLLKQGRAFGVGAWLATQNPVDIDYKAVGNAGIKCIGRLVTERDRDRVLDGLGLRELDDGRDADDLVAGLGKREFLLHDVRATQRNRTMSSRWAMSYLRGPLTLAEMGPLVDDRPAATPTGDEGGEPSALGSSTPPVLSAGIEQRFVAGISGLARPSIVARCRVAVRRASLDLDREADEWWRLPLDDRGDVDWDAAEALEEPPDLVGKPPDGMVFPKAAPAGMDRDLARLEVDFITRRARRPLAVLANPKLKLSAGIGEDRAAFEARCLEVADRADDPSQERAREKFSRKKRSLEQRLARERQELEADVSNARSRKAEEFFGVVEGLFSVLTSSRSARAASSKMRSATTRRRMSSKASAAVDESELEIERIERELISLADEMQAEIDRIADASEAKALAIEDALIRPTKTNIAVEEIYVVWE